MLTPWSMKMWESSETALGADLQTLGPRPECQFLGAQFPVFTARPDLPKQLTRMPFHQGSFQHKSSSHFPDILSTSRSIPGRLSTCPPPLTFRRSVSITGTEAHRLEKKQIPFPEKGDNTSGQHSSPGKGDLQSMLDRKRKAAAIWNKAAIATVKTEKCQQHFGMGM